MHRRVFAALLTLCLAVCTALQAAAYSPQEQYEILLETDELIRTEGLESSWEDDPLGRALVQLLEEDAQLFEDLMTAMLSGYDQHTMFLPAGSYSQAFDPETGYVGIGVTMRAHPKGALVTEVNLSSPAAKAGIQMGDILVQVGDAPLEGLSLEEISALLRGAAGTSVTVTLLHGDQIRTVALTRTALRQLNYTGAQIANGIYYMKWSRIIDDGSYACFQQGLEELEQLGDKCLILDLRDNPGGSLELAFSIVSDLLPQARPFFRIAYRTPRSEEVLAQQLITSDGSGKDIPHIFILVNENTASAAEVIAAGLRDLGYGLIVGTQSYGKARGQQHLPLEDDSAIVLTTMMLLSLRAKDYEDVGLSPDVPVENTFYRGENAIVLNEEVALAPYSCSDNGEDLNRALVSLGLLETMPEVPYQVGDQTLEALSLLKAIYLPEDDAPGASVPVLRLINQLLVSQGQGLYLRDDQLNTALDLAREAMEKDAKGEVAENWP